MNTQESSSIDKSKIADSFSAAAGHYDDFAFLQREVGERVFERLDLMSINPRTILDVGCGTGHFTRLLKKRFKKATVTGIDIAEGMIDFAKKKNGLFSKCEYQCCDLDQLPFADNSMDLIFSNLAIQWVPDLKHSMSELARVVKKDGLVIFSTLGPDTLKELKQAWESVDQEQHVNDFIDMHDVGDFMMMNGFQNPVMDMENIVLTYSTLTGLFRDLKGIGAHNMNHRQQKSLMSKSRWRLMTEAYDRLKNNEQQYPATYEVIYGHGWGRNTQENNSQENNVYKVEL